MNLPNFWYGSSCSYAPFNSLPHIPPPDRGDLVKKVGPTPGDLVKIFCPTPWDGAVFYVIKLLKYATLILFLCFFRHNVARIGKNSALKHAAGENFAVLCIKKVKNWLFY